VAIGSANSAGALALGALLVVGFVLHNTTEGLAIVVPVAALRPSLGRLVALGLIAGAPALLGTWIGAAAFTSSLAAFRSASARARSCRSSCSSHPRGATMPAHAAPGGRRRHPRRHGDHVRDGAARERLRVSKESPPSSATQPTTRTASRSPMSG
jgi:hypothetical protein